MSSDTKRVLQVFIAGIIVCVLGAAILYTRQNHGYTPIGQWIASWYDGGYMKRASAAAGGGQYFMKFGENFCWMMIIFGAGVAIIAGKHLNEDGVFPTL